MLLASGGEVQLYAFDLPEKAGTVEMVHVPAGDFVMGADGASPDEAPKHTRPLPHGYFVARHPTTWGEFKSNDVDAMIDDILEDNADEASFAQP